MTMIHQNTFSYITDSLCSPVNFMASWPFIKMVAINTNVTKSQKLCVTQSNDICDIE